MTTHKHFSMDDDAAEYLSNYGGNQSELVSELVKEYFTVGVYDTELAARNHRKRVVQRQMAEIEGELDSLRSELDALQELESERGTSSIEEVAQEIEILDPEKATSHNPAISTKAEQNGIDADVLAEEVRKQAEHRKAKQFESINADD